MGLTGCLLLPNGRNVVSNRLELLAREYVHARRIASAETGLPLTTFPEACPWTQEQVLDEDFWPEETG